MPPHRGHQFLIEFARQYCQHVTVLVCSLPGDPIPGALRFQWVRQMFPMDDVRVVHITDELPQTPEQHPDFWDIWKRVIKRAAPEGVDYFFASEDYGPKTAEVIGGGCRYVEVDRARQLVPVSGTAVRESPMQHWDLLPDAVRPFFVKRVCLFGPESTGKTTLARDLARHFETSWVHEYARPLLDPQGGKCFPDDIARIARGQIATEEAMAHQANRVLFCDTDVLTTTLWSDVLFGQTPAWVRRLADQRNYDLYMLLGVDVPWVNDNQRFFHEPFVRRQMFERFRGALESRRRRYVIIRGDWDQRFAAACQAVRVLIGDHHSGAESSVE
jgi:NadR type nicotinamide-nucleotide adenylyltransferase